MSTNNLGIPLANKLNKARESKTCESFYLTSIYNICCNYNNASPDSVIGPKTLREETSNVQRNRSCKQPTSWYPSLGRRTWKQTVWRPCETAMVALCTISAKSVCHQLLWWQASRILVMTLEYTSAKKRELHVHAFSNEYFVIRFGSRAWFCC